jgi:hypothetical protein
MQDFLADIVSHPIRQIGKNHVGVAARRLNVQGGKTEKSRNQWSSNPNRIDSVAPNPSRGFRNNAFPELHNVVIHPNQMDPPLQPKNHTCDYHYCDNPGNDYYPRIGEEEGNIPELAVLINSHHKRDSADNKCLPKHCKRGPHKA